MNKTQKTSLRNKCIYILCILYLFYYSYRYIFQYNSDNTSPTYANTPLAFQWGKYIVLFIVILFLILFLNHRFCLTKENKVLGLSVLFLVVQGVILIGAGRTSNHWILILVLFPVLFYLGSNSRIEIGAIKKILNFFFAYTVIYEFIQIVLFFQMGRLPALGYATGKITDVRFGGAWDDPNGYAILLSFFFPYYFFETKGKNRIIILGIILIMEILTWSSTGILCFVVSIILLSLIKIKKNKLSKKGFLFIMFGILLLTVLLEINLNTIIQSVSDYLVQKQESIDSHLSGWDLSEISVGSMLGVHPVDVGGEIGVVRLFSFGGFWCLLAFMAVGIDSIRKLNLKAETDKNDKAIYYGAVAYQIAFLLSQLNLPLVYCFSNIGMFAVFLILSCTLAEKTH